MIPVHLLRCGQVAEIGELTGVPDQVHRLEELGLRRGVVVEMVQPGSPCILRLANQKLCFRESDAMGVLVRAGAWN